MEKLNSETSQACTPTFVAYRSPRISTAVNLSAAEVDLPQGSTRSSESFDFLILLAELGLHRF
jgi:hypothetical protein